MGRGAGQKISMTNKELRKEEIEYHTCTMMAHRRDFSSLMKNKRCLLPAAFT